MKAILRRRRLSTVLLAALAALVLSPIAEGGLLTTLSGDCGDQTRGRPFLRWLDPTEYVFAPNGGLESGSRGWTLNGGAKVIAGNEPYYLHSPDDAYSLYLPPGSSAVTPAVCAGADEFTLRFLGKGPLFSSLSVEVLFDGPLGIKSAPIGVVAGLGSWQPTLPLASLANLTGPLSPDGDGAIILAFRIKPTGLLSGTWRVDDFYVDPFLWR